LIDLVSNAFQSLTAPSVTHKFTVNRNELVTRATAVFSLVFFTAHFLRTFRARDSFALHHVKISAALAAIASAALYFFGRANSIAKMEKTLAERMSSLNSEGLFEAYDRFAIERLKDDLNLTKNIFNISEPTSFAKAWLCAVGSPEVLEFVVRNLREDERTSIASHATEIQRVLNLSKTL